MHVAITRSADDAAELHALLAQNKVELSCIAVAERAEPDDGGVAVAATAQSLQDDDWLVFSSVRGVQYFDRFDVDNRWRSCRIAVVGNRTAQEVESHDAWVSLCAPPSMQSAAGLVEVFPRAHADEKSRVFVIRPLEATDVLEPGLAKKGWNVVPVVAYQSVERMLTDDEKTSAHDAKVVVCTSTANARTIFPLATAKARFVAIGPATAQYLRQQLLETVDSERPGAIEAVEHRVTIARTPTPADIAAAVIEALQH